MREPSASRLAIVKLAGLLLTTAPPLLLVALTVTVMAGPTRFFERETQVGRSIGQYVFAVYTTRSCCSTAEWRRIWNMFCVADVAANEMRGCNQPEPSGPPFGNNV